ncbi:MAG: TIGR04282 family arsenosugar biosynthesis glycosyltransferase [Acidimicrobiia bacterium]
MTGSESDTTHDAVVVVMAKAPLAGRVKTRLCPPFTPAEAAALASAALVDTLEAVLAVPARRVLAFDGPTEPCLADELEWRGEMELMPQCQGGLDRRIATVLENIVLEDVERSATTVLVIGMDTPQITSALMIEALALMADPGTDAVIGPATDGGWWALGLRRPEGADVYGVPMSTPHTGSAQRQRLLERGRRVVALPELRDVDTIDDARAVAAHVPGSRFAATLERLDRAPPGPLTGGRGA